MSGWKITSGDPNSPQALEYRREALSKAKQFPVANRNQYLAELARDKRVLDVGVVAHVADARLSVSWLHREIAKSARTCLGIDILDEGIAQLKAEGFNVRKADITRDVIEGEYDVMVCGEIIEHLSNPGALFQAARRVLVPGGLLVITSPNPYYLGRIRACVLGRYQDSVDHVLLINPSNVAELAEREGLQLVRFRAIVSESLHPRTLAGVVVLLIRPFLLFFGLPHEAFAETFVYECAKPSA